MLMCFTIPSFITLYQPLTFFIFITPLIYWRFYYFLKNREVYCLYDRIFKFLSHLSWTVYHTAYFTLFVIDEIKIGNTVNVEVTKKVCVGLGYILIMTILFGSAVDIIEAITAIIKVIYLCIKKIAK